MAGTTENGTEQTGLAIAGHGGTEVSSLVRLALDRGVDVEVLERLVALQERVTERDARAAFFQALADFQEACPEIPKSKTAQIKTRGGSSFNYTYAPLEAITRTIRPALKERGLSYSWDVEAVDGVLNVICVLRHVEGHVERSTFPVPTATDAAMSAAQKNGAALTYGRRQSLVAVLGLTTADDDPDAPLEGFEVEAITEGQVADLQALIEEVGADTKKVLGWLKVGSLADIPAPEYTRAVRALEGRRK